LSLPLADQLLVTQLHDIFEGDAYFPEIPTETFEITEKVRGIPDEKNAYQYSYITYTRK
jgi:dihydrofolate reductase